MKYFLILFLLIFLFLSCQEEVPQTITPAFYHWQTQFRLSNSEKEYLEKLEIDKLYVKFFDVDWDGRQAVPQAIIDFSKTDTTLINQKEIIPTIFITNRTIKNLDESGLKDLAEKVVGKIDYLLEKNGFSIQELQFDCDWTLSTRDAYFSFLETVREKVANLKKLSISELQLSATIRLHQIKFFEKTGVPPVDKGILMYYNMGDLEDWKEQNSILNNEIGKQYLNNFEDYPLSLDLALPIYAWGVLYRDGRMIRLMNDLREDQMQDSSYFVKIEESRFEIIKSTYLDGHYLYKGDQIRLEKISLQQLEEAIDLLQPRMKTPNLIVSFYHLDSSTVKYFPYENLEKVLLQLE